MCIRDRDREEVLQKVIEAFCKYYELLRRADYMDVSGIYQLSFYRRKGYHWYEDKDGKFEGAFVEVEDDGDVYKRQDNWSCRARPVR